MRATNRRLPDEYRSAEQVAHDEGRLVCIVCARSISPNELSMQAGPLVACHKCAEVLCLFLDFEMGFDGAALSHWQAHCRGEV